MARETINGISVPIPGTGEPPDFVGDLRRIASAAGPRRNTLGVLGDSQTDFGTDASTSILATGSKNAKGYWVWALVALRQRLLLTKDAGVAGDSAQDVLNRLAAYLTDVPGWTLLMIGTNDAAGLVSVAEYTTRVSSILDQLDAAGSRVVLTTVPPRGSTTTAVLNRIHEYNNWIKQQAHTRPGLLVVDINPYVGAATGGGWRTNYDQDAVHFAPLGASKAGKRVADVVSPFIAAVDPLPAAAADAKNLITNPFMDGTTGQVLTGGTGSVATGYAVSAIDGVASTFTCSKVARTDGLPGEWQQVSVASGQVKLAFNVTGYGTTYTEGDRVYAVCEFETDTDFADGGVTVPSNYFRLKVVGTKPDFGDGMAGFDLNNNSDTRFLGGSDGLRSGVLLTPVITIPSSATQRLAFELQRKGAGTFRAARCAIYREGTGPAY